MKANKKLNISPVLINAEAMAREHPGTFQIPDSRGSLVVGDYVKIACEGERFWCVIDEVKDGIYSGEVRNAVFTPGLSLGSKIKFAPANIYQAMRGEEFLP